MYDFLCVLVRDQPSYKYVYLDVATCAFMCSTVHLFIKDFHTIVNVQHSQCSAAFSLQQRHQQHNQDIIQPRYEYCKTGQKLYESTKVLRKLFFFCTKVV